MPSYVLQLSSDTFNYYCTYTGIVTLPILIVCCIVRDISYWMFTSHVLIFSRIFHLISALMWVPRVYFPQLVFSLTFFLFRNLFSIIDYVWFFSIYYIDLFTTLPSKDTQFCLKNIDLIKWNLSVDGSCKFTINMPK